MGLQAGSLPLAMEVMRYTGTPYSERVCRLCDCEEVGDKHNVASLIQLDRTILTLQYSIKFFYSPLRQ